MGGETEQEVSSWTVDSLHTLMLRLLDAERDFSASQREIIEEKIARIDKASELLNDTVNRVPTDVQKAVSELRTLMDERAAGIDQRFAANAVLSETESRLNQLALAAALAAQKEAAGVQTQTFTSLINGQGAAVDAAINKNAELAQNANSALSDRVTALDRAFARLDTRIAEVIASKTAQVEQKSDTRAGNAILYTLVGLVIGAIGIILSVVLR